MKCGDGLQHAFACSAEAIEVRRRQQEALGIGVATEWDDTELVERMLRKRAELEEQKLVRMFKKVDDE